MKQQTKSKALMILNIILLLALFTIPVYAYWAGSFAAVPTVDQTNDVTIGEGEEVKTTITLGGNTTNDAKLIPGDKAIIEIKVTWVENKNAAGANGVITASDFILTGTVKDEITPAELGQMFTVSANNVSITNGSTETIELTVVFSTAPADKVMYDKLMAAGNLKVTATIKLTPNA